MNLQSSPRIIDERDMDDALDRSIRAGLCRCLPDHVKTFSHTRAFHGSVPAYCAVVERDGVVIAHAGATDRTIRVAGRPIRVAGVQNVFVLPEHRGRGLVDEVLASLLAEATRRRAELGLLFCFPVLEKVYHRRGWSTVSPRRIHATTTTADRHIGRSYDLDATNIAMFHPIMLDTFPPGEIDLGGDDW